MHKSGHKAKHVLLLILPLLLFGEYSGTSPNRPVPSIMHFQGENYFCEWLSNLFALLDWEMDESQTLSQFCLTFDKGSWGKTAALISLALPFNNAPIESKLFFLPWGGKYLGKVPPFRLSLKGQAALNLMETPFKIYTRFAGGTSSFHAFYNSISPMWRGRGWGCELQQCGECQDNAVTFWSPWIQMGIYHCWCQKYSLCLSHLGCPFSLSLRSVFPCSTSIFIWIYIAPFKPGSKNNLQQFLYPLLLSRSRGVGACFQ